MPAITVKNIPEELYENLKAAAKAHHRSINGELIHCLENTLRQRLIDPAQHLASARRLRAQIEFNPNAEQDIDAAKRQGRS